MNPFLRTNSVFKSTSLFLILLLALSIATSSIGIATYDSTSKQFKAIDKQYITIAVPSGTNYQKLHEGGSVTYFGSDSALFSDGSKYIGAVDAQFCAQRSEYFKFASSGIFLNAYISDTVGLTSGTMDTTNYNASIDQYCYALSVLAVRCKSVEIIPDDFFDSYKVNFELIDPVCRMDVYDLPPYEDEIILIDKIMTAEGDIPFEVDRTYLIRGLYSDYPISLIDTLIHKDEDGGKQIELIYGRGEKNEWTYRSFCLDSGDSIQEQFIGVLGTAPGLDNHVTEQKKYPDSDKFYKATPKNCWPYYEEYKGDWRDFLSSDAGAVWRDEIIPNYEKNHASVSVVLTDDINGMYLFNTGDASIVDGRSIEKEEYQSGAEVCLVSAAYAQHNGLCVGDTINIDYYDTGYGEITYDIPNSMGRIGMTVQRYPLTEDTHLDIQKDYTIVGIYTAPEWSSGVHNFHADTIFVPKASVPGVASRSESLQFLYSVIIENGSIETFEAHMAANDMAGAYLYFDQGYSEAATTVQSLVNNARRIMIVGISMFALSALLFLLLYIRRSKPVIRTMRLLGVSSQKTWRECFATLLVPETIAVLLGNVSAILLYDWITQKVLSTSLDISLGSIILCGSVQFLVLFVVGTLWTRSVAKRNLMQKR